VDQLIYIFECRLGLRDENSSLNTKTLIGSSLINRFREFKVTSRNSKQRQARRGFVFVYIPRLSVSQARSSEFRDKEREIGQFYRQGFFLCVPRLVTIKIAGHIRAVS
jgi:hypothetical protein